ncbi:hypothetical protein [Halobaculum sp. EA56]|uniref:hypothetical protein n=1 Tax=Halobaculum sp. EA56 TaxID=3421648 RepID=UPI003EBBA226
MSIDESALARELRNNGIDVADVSVSADRVEVTYTTTLPGAEPDHGEMGTLCTAFIDLVEEGEFEPRRVEATSLRFEDDVQATWHVEGEWFEALDEYRISEEEFSARVLDSVETDPDVDAPAAGGEGSPQ